MSGTVNLLVGLAMGLNLIALGSSRLPSIIRAAAVQGMLLNKRPMTPPSRQPVTHRTSNTLSA